jgi:TetR/AcrR family transcriptional regulator
MADGTEANRRSKTTRRRFDPDRSREMILDATERLMRREGYGAVSTRRVAAEAGLKPPLVHYYYRTTDDLLLAFYQRTAAGTRERLEAVLASDRPLHGLWAMNIDRERTALAAEFIALANHRKAISAEICRNVAIFRAMQAEALAAILAKAGAAGRHVDPTVATVLLAAIGIGLVLEDQVGVQFGHDATVAFVETMIDGVEE